MNHELHSLFNFGGFPIFGLMTAIGFICGAVMWKYNARSINDTHVRKDDTVIIAGFAFIAAIGFSSIAGKIKFSIFT